MRESQIAPLEKLSPSYKEEIQREGVVQIGGIKSNTNHNGGHESVRTGGKTEREVVMLTGAVAPTQSWAMPRLAKASEPRGCNPHEPREPSEGHEHERASNWV